MVRWSSTLVVVALSLLGVTNPTGAQRDLNIVPSSQLAERRIALVIGNGAYTNAPKLANPTNDAQLIAETLVAVGFRLVGGAPVINADRPHMERAIRDFGQELRSGAIGLFYFAGHGIQVREENWLVPVGANIANESDVNYELIRVGLILDEMTNAGNRLNILILDACRNNPFGGRRLRTTRSGLAQVTAPAGTVISYATQPGNVAADGIGKYSPYTAELARTIAIPGLGLFDTFNAVGLAVKRATAGLQQPWLATSPVEGSFAFVAATPSQLDASSTEASRAREDAEVVFWTSIRDRKSRSDFEAYLRQYPNGRFASLARNWLAAEEQQPVGTAGPSQPVVAAVPASRPSEEMRLSTVLRLLNEGIGHFPGGFHLKPDGTISSSDICAKWDDDDPGGGCAGTGYYRSFTGATADIRHVRRVRAIERRTVVGTDYRALLCFEPNDVRYADAQKVTGDRPCFELYARSLDHLRSVQGAFRELSGIPIEPLECTRAIFLLGKSKC